jgi:hypothetical protein
MKSILQTIVLIACSLVLLPTLASGQVAAGNVAVLTTSTNAVAASTTATVTSDKFVPNGLTGFAVMPAFALDGPAVTTVTLNFQASADGTTWTTTYPVSAAFTATGTSAVRGYYNVPPAVTGTGPGNMRYLRLGQVINSNTNAVTFSSITVLKSNK